MPSEQPDEQKDNRQFTDEQKELAWAWIERLESGKYPQTKGCLKRTEGSDAKPVGECCLGVLCSLLIEQGLLPQWTPSVLKGYLSVEGEDDYLPESVVKLMGLESLMGFGSVGATLADRNDNGETFAQIAGYIRTYYGFPPASTPDQSSQTDQSSQ